MFLGFAIYVKREHKFEEHTHFGKYVITLKTDILVFRKVYFCYLFLLSVFILWFSYYFSDIFCKF